MLLILFPDSTYSWKYRNNEYPRMGKLEAIAFGYWSYKIAKKEIELAMDHMNIVHNIAEFDETIKCILDLKQSVDILQK